MAQLTNNEKKQIVVLFMDKNSTNFIAETMGRNFRTVDKFIKEQLSSDFVEYKDLIEKYNTKKEEIDKQIVEEIAQMRTNNVKVANLALQEIKERLEDKQQIKKINVFELTRIAGVASDKVIKLIEIESDKSTHTTVEIVNDLPTTE